MITIHATKKLYQKLPLNADGLLTPTIKGFQPQPSVVANNPLSGWHANLLILQRRNCVLLVHDATRFPVFIKELVKADLANFDWHFIDAFMNTLLKAGATDQHMNGADKLLARCRFDTVCNRSVQGTMNQMAGDIEHMLWFDNVRLEEVGSYSAGAWLADRPCRVKGVKDWVWPVNAMLDLLNQS